MLVCLVRFLIYSVFLSTMAREYVLLFFLKDAHYDVSGAIIRNLGPLIRKFSFTRNLVLDAGLALMPAKMDAIFLIIFIYLTVRIVSHVENALMCVRQQL